MKKIILGLAVVAMAAATSAFTESKVVGIHAGVLSMGNDSGGLFYNVEQFGTTRTSCEEAEQDDLCSFEFDAATLPSKIYDSDNRINSRNEGALYQ